MSELNCEHRKCISWDEFFMETALLAAKRSKDPKTQVGACIVNPENRIVGVGYNGAPNGWNDNDFPWNNKKKHSYVCHAELNAILNKFSADLKNCVIYVTLFPCMDCAKIIVQSGIKKVIYKECDNGRRDNIEDSNEIFFRAKINCIPYNTNDQNENEANPQKKMKKNV